MGNINNKEEIAEIKIKEIDVYTKGKNGNCRFVLSYNDILEPHIRRIDYYDDFKSDILAIIAALEYLETKDFNKINVYSESKESIEYIYDCIFHRNKDSFMSTSILYLISNKSIKFYHKDLKNNFIKTMLNY